MDIGSSRRNREQNNGIRPFFHFLFHTVWGLENIKGITIFSALI